MAYTAAQLITNSWYLSGIISRDLQTVPGSYMSDGLSLLNAVLAIKTANTRLIPYYQFYDTTAVVGQEVYFIPNLLQAETLTFTLGVIRYQVVPKSRKIYFGSGRVNNIQSLMSMSRFERTLGGSNLYLYFLPNSPYPLQIFGKFGLTEITSLSTDLETVYDDYYIEYLRYALAEYMCSEFGITSQPQSYRKLQEYEAIIEDISPMDLTMRKMSSMQDSTGINYAYVNLSGGFWI